MFLKSYACYWHWSWWYPLLPWGEILFWVHTVYKQSVLSPVTITWKTETTWGFSLPYFIWVWAKNRWPHSSAVGMMPWGCSIATWVKIQIKFGRHGFYIYAVLSIAPHWPKYVVFENLENSEWLHGMPGGSHQNKLRRINFSPRKYVSFNCSKFNWAMHFLTLLTKNSFPFINLEKKKCALEIKK